MTVPIPFPFPPVIDPSFVDELAERIRGLIQRIRDAIETGARLFQRGLELLARFTFGLAQAYLDGLVSAFNRCIEIVNQIATKIGEIIDWLQGPANVEALGHAIIKTYPPKLQTLSDSLLREKLKSNDYWTGDGAEAFFGSALRQKGAVDALKGAITPLGNTLVSVGSSGKNILIGLDISITAAAVTLVVAIGVTCAFPPAAGVTVPICLAVFTFVAAVIVAALVAANALAQSVSGAKAAFESQLPGDAHWPKGVGGGGKAAAEAERDGTVTDGDASWSTGHTP
ncbi:hypothetical protein HJ590_17685 [Naumannella sp. ID2617S]|nr:hypothetical protein [Naumannella sp. ID2617S]